MTTEQDAQIATSLRVGTSTDPSAVQVGSWGVRFLNADKSIGAQLFYDADEKNLRFAVGTSTAFRIMPNPAPFGGRAAVVFPSPLVFTGDTASPEEDPHPILMLKAGDRLQFPNAALVADRLCTFGEGDRGVSCVGDLSRIGGGGLWIDHPTATGFMRNADGKSVAVKGGV